MSFVDSLLGHPRSYYDMKLLSSSTCDDVPFSSQIDDVEKAIEKLVKSGKIFFWRNSFPSTTRPYSEYDYRFSCPLTNQQTSVYELEHMRSRFAVNTLSCYTNHHHYNQRVAGHTEHFPLSRRKNKSSESNVYTALDQRFGSEYSYLSRVERVKIPSVKDGISCINDDDMTLSGLSTTSRVLPNYIYEDLVLKNYSTSTSLLQQDTSSMRYPFTYPEFSTKLNASIENRNVNNFISSIDVKNPSFFYRKKTNSIIENNDTFSLIPNKMKNIIAPIGTKSSIFSKSVESLNQQILDATDSIKPLHYCFPDERYPKNCIDNNTLLNKYMVSGMSMHFSWNDRIWTDVKNLGITSNSNSVGLDVLC